MGVLEYWVGVEGRKEGWVGGMEGRKRWEIGDKGGG